MMSFSFKNITIIFLLFLTYTSFGQIKPKNNWWLEEPFRMVQTNLREIDAIDFDVAVYSNSLKDLGANTVLINVGGIAANYYTKLEYQYQNPHLKFNIIKEVVDKLHKEGIRVIGRFDFSKLNEEYASQNSEWLYKSIKGKEVNYNQQVHTCVNGGYQQDYSLKILKEALTLFPLDGVFFNMIGYKTTDYSKNYHGICQSKSCKIRFKEWSGGTEIPLVEDNNDSIFRKYKQFKKETSDELILKIQEVIKSFGNHIAICTYTHAGTDFFRKESSSGKEMHSHANPWEYDAAHNVKVVLGSWKDKQVSNASNHFLGYPGRHSADSRWLAQKRLFQDVMYGAGVDFYCMGRLDNLEDRPLLKGIKDVFKFHEKNEKYLHHTTSENKILLLHNKKTEDEYKGVFEMLTENHVLFDVMEHWCVNTKEVPREIESYEVIILPDIRDLSKAACIRLDNYVKAGGKLLVTGLTSTNDEIGNPLNKIQLNTLGVASEYKLLKKIQGTYFKIFEKDKVQLNNPIFKDIDLVYAWEKGLLCTVKKEASSLLGYIPPAMIGPPEKTYYEEVTKIPGLIFNKEEKGKTVFFPFRIGAMYHHKRQYGHSALVLSALKSMLSYEKDIATDISPLIEISRQKSKDNSFKWYGLLNHSGQLGNGFYKPFPVKDISFIIEQEKQIKSIKGLKSKKEIKYTQIKNGKIKITVPELDSYEVVLIEY